MCGLSGFANVSGEANKLLLTYALGRGIDTRGGHGCGFVSIKNQKVNPVKNGGEWGSAPRKFLMDAASSDMLLMHSRWATCGERNQARQAHPFTIKRNNKAVLHGAHNGIIFNADESAKEHNRQIEVDSEELFHLIADKDYEGVQNLTGYGIAMWVMADGDHIKLARLSDDGEMVVVKLTNGGLVWASTWDILAYAIRRAGMKVKWQLNISEVGRVFEIYHDKVKISSTKGIQVGSRWKSDDQWNSDDIEWEPLQGE